MLGRDESDPVAAGQGGTGVGARGVRRAPRDAIDGERGARPAPDASEQRHLPRLGAAPGLDGAPTTTTSANSVTGRAPRWSSHVTQHDGDLRPGCGAAPRPGPRPFRRPHRHRARTSAAATCSTERSPSSRRVRRSERAGLRHPRRGREGWPHPIPNFFLFLLITAQRRREGGRSRRSATIRVRRSSSDRPSLRASSPDTVCSRARTTSSMVSTGRLAVHRHRWRWPGFDVAHEDPRRHRRRR